MCNAVRKHAIAALAGVAFFAAVWFAHGNASAAACGTPTLSTAGAIAFSAALSVYTSPQTIIPVTYTGTCKTSGDTVVLTFGPGSHLTGTVRAMLCTSGCGTYTTDLLEYDLCSNATCTTTIASNGTVTFPGGTTKTGGSYPWTETIYAVILTSVPGGTNDSGVGTYADSVLVTVS